MNDIRILRISMASDDIRIEYRYGGNGNPRESIVLKK